MKLVVTILLIFLSQAFATAADWDADFTVFIEESCVACHDADTDTSLDLTSLGFDLENEDVFRTWVKVFDRVERHEMPPESDPQPNAESRRAWLSDLRTELTRVNRLRQQEIGRVPSRRLSRQEYENTLHDLLGIGGNIAKHLPPENEASGFDVAARSQEMSSVHVRSLLNAADHALDEAIQVGEKPMMSPRKINYFHSPYIQMWVDRPVRRGGGTIFKTDQDVVTFRGENFVFRSDASGFRPPVAGRYRQLARRMPDNGSQVVMFTHQDASVWADLSLILWAAGLRVTSAWCIATETDSTLKSGNYVQGTVLLVCRKRTNNEPVFLDEISHKVELEVREHRRQTHPCHLPQDFAVAMAGRNARPAKYAVRGLGWSQLDRRKRH